MSVEKEEVAASQKTVELITAGITGALAGIVIFDSYRLGNGWSSDGPQAGYFPFFIGAILLLASLYNVFTALKTDASKIFLEKGPAKLVMMILIPLGVYVLAVEYLGLYVASIIYIAIFMVWLGKYSYLMAAMVSIGVMALFFVTFEIWFKVPLLKGPLENLLGLN
jgi:putative tricarboxylic transport membrane protein